MTESQLQPFSYLDLSFGVQRDYSVELSPLKKVAPALARIASIGVGNGEEIQGLRELYPDAQLIGVDLSTSALEIANARISFEPIVADATNLPFRGTLDAVIFASLLHEVFSYNKDGETSWRKAIQSAESSLSENGYLYIRDSAAPEKKNGNIEFKTSLAKDFATYFNKHWAFSGKIDDPSPELLFHFVNFWKEQSNTRMGDPAWKEMQEAYYLPKEDGALYSQDEYVREVLKAAPSLRCVSNGQSMRPGMENILRKNFRMKNIPDYCRKMELVFKKVKTK